MAKVCVSRQIKADVEEVFRLFSDFENVEKNIEGIKKLDVLTDGPIGSGTRFRETRVMFGKAHTEEMEIESFKPNESYMVTADSAGAHYEATYRFTPQDGGTRVDLEFVATPVTLFAKMMAPLSFMMAGTLKKCLENDIDDLQKIAESGAPAF